MQPTYPLFQLRSFSLCLNLNGNFRLTGIKVDSVLIFRQSKFKVIDLYFVYVCSRAKVFKICGKLEKERFLAKPFGTFDPLSD